MNNEINIELYKHPPKFKERIITDKEKDYTYYSEALHSSYLFYTMEVDKLNKQLLAEQAKNKELENILNVLGGKTVAICEFDKPIEFWGAKDHLIASLQAKNKKLVEALEAIVESKCSECDLYVAHLDICGADKSYEANGKRHKEICWEHCTNKLLKIQRTAQQALNEVNK